MVSALLIIGIATLIGVAAGFALFPLYSLVLAPVLPSAGIANLQIMFGQLAAKTGLLVPADDGSYDWRAADDAGDHLAVDIDGHTYELSRTDRLHRVGWRPFGIVSVVDDRTLKQLAPDDLERSQGLSDRIRAGGDTYADGGGRVPLADTDQGERLFVPSDVYEAADDPDADVIDLRSYTRDMGTMGDSRGVQHAEREGKQDAGPGQLSPLMILLGIAAMAIAGALTGLYGAGAIG
jgi:hypothetical protein